tara:strand:+ start:16 stop:954 length:939 start_codon:yes stop_codon:yes gene_type:complete
VVELVSFVEKMTKIFTIIVTYNGMHWINKCLSNIKESSAKSSILIVDNNSTDGTPQFIKKYYPECIIIQNKINLGFGKGNNLGLRYVIDHNADYVVLLNQDVYVNENTFLELIEVHKKNSQLGIISPLQLNGCGTELDDLFSTYMPSEYNNSFKANIGGLDLIETDFVNAAIWLLPIEIIEKIGGFDPLFSHYGEDKDYCHRATFYGYKIGITPNSSAIHDRYYDDNNRFRNLENHLFSMGLAHLKNINTPLLKNYCTWIIQRLIRVIKLSLKGKFTHIKIEILVINKLLSMKSKIKNSRSMSQYSSTAFIS